MIVPLDAAGNFNVFSQSGGHLIVDLVGFITGRQRAGVDRRPVRPARRADPLPRHPRRATNPLGGTQMALPGWNFEVPVTANPVVGRTDVAAVALNVTVTDPLSPGYVTLGAGRLRTIPASKIRTHRDGQRRARRADAAEPRDRRRLARAASTCSRSRRARRRRRHRLLPRNRRSGAVPRCTGRHEPDAVGCPGFAGAPVGAIVTGSSSAP